MTSPATTSTGLAPHVAGALAYVLGPITGVVFLVIEKDNRFVRFHAAQSIAVSFSKLPAPHAPIDARLQPPEPMRPSDFVKKPSAR